jgi:hypothetical protein
VIRVGGGGFELIDEAVCGESASGGEAPESETGIGAEQFEGAEAGLLAGAEGVDLIEGPGAPGRAGLIACKHALGGEDDGAGVEAELVVEVGFEAGADGLTWEEGRIPAGGGGGVLG